MRGLSSGARAFSFRLTPKQDLKKSIVAFAKENGIKAGSIVTCVGSLQQLHIRFANQKKGDVRNGFFEIVSLTGTFSGLSTHLHLAISDQQGNTIGGHLLDDNIIYTTAEIVILELTDLEFDREPDAVSGFNELTIRLRKSD